MSLLSAEHLDKTYYLGKSCIHALSDVSFSLQKGESLGIVGESGSGKTTLSRILTLLERPDSGHVLLNGTNIERAEGKARQAVYRSVQLIFQNPALSFQPRWTVWKSLQQAARNFGIPGAEIPVRIRSLAQGAGLKEALLDHYPHALSGGECQRAALIRALLPGPEVLICDEATSALDAATGGQILSLLEQVSGEQHIALLVISHDLAVVDRLCSRTIVLQEGRTVEEGPTRQLMRSPEHAYTKLLLSSAGLWEEKEGQR